MTGTRLGSAVACVIAAVQALGAVGARADEVGPYGPPLGVKADVVRSFTLKTSGAVTKEVNGRKGDGQTGLRGQCDPKTFANFGVEKGSLLGEQAEVAIVTRDPIATGATGEFRLDKVYVRFFDDANGERRFGGPGKLTLTVHEAAAGRRRLSGAITGAKLEGFDTQRGKRLDVTATFDLDFSCGVR
jgi:hypothetical protein